LHDDNIRVRSIDPPVIALIDFGKSCFFNAPTDVFISSRHVTMAGCEDRTPNSFDIFCLGSVMRECILYSLQPPLTADSTDHECLVLINESFHPYYNLAMKCRLPIKDRITIDQFLEEMRTLPETITYHDGNILTTVNYVKPIAPPNTKTNYVISPILQPEPKPVKRFKTKNVAGSKK